MYMEQRFKNKITAGEMDKYQGKEAFPELLEEQLFMLQCGKVFSPGYHRNKSVIFSEKCSIW